MSGNKVNIQPSLECDFNGTTLRIEPAVNMAADLELPGLMLAVEGVRAGMMFGFEADGQGKIHLLVPAPSVTGPTGARAQLALPGINGGGYLNHVANQWRGALQARVGPVNVAGLGLLDTEKFGLLVVLGVEFPVPIQLSFGFTLNAVGGVVGINHGIDAAALGRAISAGTAEAMLFPSDPVGQADTVLPQLAACFPFRQGSWVVGPTLAMGWGTPTLISAKAAVLISDSEVAVVGNLAVTLPHEDAALIVLKATILGRFDASGISIDGSLAGSRILMMPIDGDIKLRIRSGSDALMAFSAGGFHPAFAPPADMVGMKRLSTHISPGPIIDLRLSAYFAVTTGSVQFGAAVDLQAGVSGFGIKGHAAFDALFRFDPFRFQADLEASVSVECADFEVGSVALHASLSGPAPWRIAGHASISILFWDVDVDIPEITWGESEAPGLPPARDPATVLAAQIGQAQSWTATSGEVPALARLQPAATDPAIVLVHPLATLGLRQSSVPVGTLINRMDGVPLAAPTKLLIRSEGEDLALAGVEAFPPNQFFDLDDARKLTSAGFTTCPNGVDLPAKGNAVGTAASHPQREEIVLLPESGPGLWADEFVLPFTVVQDLSIPPLMRISDPATPRVVEPDGTDVTASVRDVTGGSVSAVLAAITSSATAGFLQQRSGIDVARLNYSLAWER